MRFASFCDVTFSFLVSTSWILSLRLAVAEWKSDSCLSKTACSRSRYTRLFKSTSSILVFMFSKSECTLSFSWKIEHDSRWLSHRICTMESTKAWASDQWSFQGPVPMSTVSQTTFKEGRYQVSLPWKPESRKLPENHRITKKKKGLRALRNDSKDVTLYCGSSKVEDYVKRCV